MGTLMACRGPSYAGVAVHDANILREDDSTEFRARGGSFWSQTTTTLALSETGEILPSPSDLPLQRDLFGLESRARLPLYARRGSGLHTARNLFLRGADLLHGEDSTRRPQDTLLSASALLAQTDDGRLPVGLKRNLSYSSHQPIIHEFPLEMYQDSPKKGRDASGKYLDMTGSKHKRNSASLADGSGRSVSSKGRRSYVNVKDEPGRQSGLSTTQGHQVHPEDKKIAKNYVNVPEGEAGEEEAERAAGRGEEQTKVKHHYLPMTVHPHRAVILHSPVTPDNDVDSNEAVEIQGDDNVQVETEQQGMADEHTDDSSSRESIKSEKVERGDNTPEEVRTDVPEASTTPTESTGSPKSCQSSTCESPVIVQTAGHCENNIFHAPLENSSSYCNGANRTAFTCLHACGETGNSVVFILPHPCCHEQGVHTAHRSPQHAKVSPHRKRAASPPSQKHRTLTPLRRRGTPQGTPQGPSEKHAAVENHYERSDSRGTGSTAEDGECEPENQEEKEETDDLLLSLVPLDLEDDEIAPETQDHLPVITRKQRNTAL